MEGGSGNDTYHVDNANDVVREYAGQGDKDKVVTTVSYTLGVGVQVEYLEAGVLSGSINLTGNEFRNTITGNTGANVINGGGDADKMYGGKGNDIYYVDNAADVVFERTGEGTDRVRTSVSYQLMMESEIEYLETTDAAGTSAINLTGDGLRNTIIGNNGSNSIDGSAGADTMEGRGGNDTYLVDNIGDVVVEGVGGGLLDRVQTSTTYALAAGSEVEALETGLFLGNDTRPINLTGNSFSQTITGNDGSNIIAGLGGDDTLTGAGGADTFVFDHLGPANQNQEDIITDFTDGVDRIDLRSTGVQNFNDLLSAGDRYMEDVGNDVLIHTSVSANTSILLQNVLFSSLDASDFLFS